MKFTIFFLLVTLSLSADLYDRNKYNMDFPPQDQQHYMPSQEGSRHVQRQYPAHHQRECPCDPGDPQCPCEIDADGSYHRVD